MTEEAKTKEPKIDPAILGQLVPDEYAMIVRMNQQLVNAKREIAELEVRKFRVLAGLDGIERAMNQQLGAIGSRLQIPSEVTWQVVSDAEGRGFARALSKDPEE